MENKNQPNMLDYVKAVSDADRLKIIGRLTKGPIRAQELATEFGIPLQEAFNSLSALEFVGAVHKEGDVFSLAPKKVDALARSQFNGDKSGRFEPSPSLDDASRKVLRTYLNADGSIRQIPSQGSKLTVVLTYLLDAFETGRDYTEKEVNQILARYNIDTSGLRRDLIDAGMLQREGNGSRYWRPQ